MVNQISLILDITTIEKSKNSKIICVLFLRQRFFLNKINSHRRNLQETSFILHVDSAIPLCPHN